MGRGERIEYKGAIYHVIQRGNNREYIFHNEIWKGYLIKIIKEMKARYNFKFFGYVIMDNHYHLIIQTLDIPISKIMHGINSRYGKYYNHNTKRIGPVFQNRYKGIIVEDERYLLGLLKYIHLNPVKAKMCSSIDQYKWSSDVFYRRNIKSLVDIDEVLDIMSVNRIEAIRKYIDFMDDEREDNNFSTEMFENAIAIGSSNFKGKLIMENDSKIMALDEILKEVCPTEEEYNLIKNASRKRYLTEYKISYIKKAREYNYSYSEIGNYIGISDAAVINLADK